MNIFELMKNKVHMTSRAVDFFLSNKVFLNNDKNSFGLVNLEALQGPFIYEEKDESFLDFEYKDLNKKPLYIIRKMLLNDVEDWKNLPSRTRKDKMNQLFEKILKFQPIDFNFSYRSFENDEQRFFIDIISSPKSLNVCSFLFLSILTPLNFFFDLYLL